MKKLLLSCLLGLGIGANAQTTVFEDNFDGYTDFAIANVGNWTLRDIDLSTTYGFNGVTFANSGVAKSFQVFNSMATNPVLTPTAESDWSARSGNKMMVAFASTVPTNNDWMISPQVLIPAAGTSEVSFWAKATDATYSAEKFRVYVSTTGTQVADFTALDGVQTISTGITWQQIAYDLSAYAGQSIHVAIQCTSNDQFGFAVDDFKIVNSAAQTEAPGCPTLTMPTNGSTTVAVNPSVSLSWSASATGGVASSYDVYFGTTANPTTLLRNVTTTSTSVTGLAPLTTYYWRVVSKNVVGEATGCTEYSFTTADSNPPGCVGSVSPAAGATNIAALTTPLSWSAPTTGGVPTTYDVYWGETADAMIKLGTTPQTSVDITNTSYNTTYFWRIVPVNADGEATGCQTYSFTTESSPAAPYCGPMTYSTPEAITSVNMKFNTANVSSEDSTIAHEFFLAKEFKAEQGGTTEISVNSNTEGNFTHYYSVFVDWNQDNDFDDANEKFYTTSGNFFTNINSTGTLASEIKTKSLAVPADALVGKTRMRIKAVFASSTAPSAAALANISNACANTGGSYGQAEDYTLEVVPLGTLAVHDINKAKVSVYPNPFVDVLRISDVKNVKSVIISDASGRQVKTVAPASEINLADLKTGLYIISLKMEDGTVTTTKAIKK